MDEEIYISSLIAHVAPSDLKTVKDRIEKVLYAEVPLEDEQGKLIVVIDAPSTKAQMKTLDAIRDISGIQSLIPVYQHDEAALRSAQTQSLSSGGEDPQ